MILRSARLGFCLIMFAIAGPPLLRMAAVLVATARLSWDASATAGSKACRFETSAPPVHCPARPAVKDIDGTAER